MNKSKIKYRLVGILVSVLILLTGCSDTDVDPLVDAKDLSYSGVERTTVDVKRGSIIPVFETNIDLSGYNEVIYRIDATRMDEITEQFGAELGELHVNIGDHVKSGDLLISFKSKDLQDKLNDGEKRKKEAQLQIEHYRKLMAIDSSMDFSTEINSLNNDIRVADLHIEEVRNTYQSLNIVAEADGVVSFIDPAVKDGYLLIGAPLIKAISFDDYYIMSGAGGDNQNTKYDKSLMVSADEIDFKVGNVYSAKSALSEYKVEVISDPNKEEEATVGDAVSSDTVYFRLVDFDGMVPEKTLNLHVEMDEIKDTCYVEMNAIIKYNDERFVYREQEDGSFCPVKVVLGNSVGQYVVIKEGLSEGDKVSIPF
ncbi:MAG: efflux RND transporter periplasmic adaptor subunit [Eubacterium sp.]|nr:efflux RND transporter periplasmic adaptor subunit [Eubacterium sp.]